MTRWILSYGLMMSKNPGGSGGGEGGIVPSYSNNMGLARQTHARRQVPGACQATGGRAPFTKFQGEAPPTLRTDNLSS